MTVLSRFIMLFFACALISACSRSVGAQNVADYFLALSDMPEIGETYSSFYNRLSSDSRFTLRDETENYRQAKMSEWISRQGEEAGDGVLQNTINIGSCDAGDNKLAHVGSQRIVTPYVWEGIYSDLLDMGALSEPSDDLKFSIFQYASDQSNSSAENDRVFLNDQTVRVTFVALDNEGQDPLLGFTGEIFFLVIDVSFHC